MQTRTNLAPVPAASGDSRTVAGIALTVVGTGVEFGQTYVDVRWAGTATTSGNLQYGDTVSTSSPNPTSNALVTPGLTYTCSVGYRLIAGTYPAFSSTRLFLVFRGTATTTQNVIVTSLPNATLQRVSATAIALTTANNVQNVFQMQGVTAGFTCDFTLRFYAPNTELGVGNARPLLQRYVPETIAGIGDLDAEALLAFDSSENRLLSSEALESGVWVLGTGCTITANAGSAPNGTLTADRLDCNLAGTLLALNQGVTTTVVAGDAWTASIWVRNASPGMSFRVFRLGGGTVEFGVINIPVSSEWQRISVTHTFAASHTGARLDIVAPAGVTSVELWGAQLNFGPVALPYTPTTTTAQTFNINTGTFVSVLRDQSNNGRHLVQATAANQPSIIGNGAVNTVNGRPMLRFDGTNHFMDAAAPIALGGVNAVLNSLEGAVFSDFKGIFGGQTTANWTSTGSASTVRAVNNTGTPRVNGVSTTEFSPLATLKVVSSNNSVTAAEATGWRLAQDRGVTTRRWNGNFAEVVAFPAVLPAGDLSVLENNQMAYYRITP